MSRRILILDAYPPALRSLMTPAFEGDICRSAFGEGIAYSVSKVASGNVVFNVVNAVGTQPDQALVRYCDAVIWSGSPLSVLDKSDGMKRLTEWMSICLEAGKPLFGICFGLQLASQVAGGTVERNSKGDELVVARKISISAIGEKHPMMDRRNGPYDALSYHSDVVTRLPAGGICLASNEMSAIQAAVFVVGNTEVWGVQYHPEMTFFVIEKILEKQRDELLSSGFFKDDRDYSSYMEVISSLADQPDALDAARHLEIDEDVLNPAIRLAELECWLDQKVL